MQPGWGCRLGYVPDDCGDGAEVGSEFLGVCGGELLLQQLPSIRPGGVRRYEDFTGQIGLIVIDRMPAPMLPAGALRPG